MACIQKSKIKKTLPLFSSSSESDKEPKPRRMEEIVVWVKVGEGDPEEVSVGPNISISKLKKEIRKNEEFHHLLYVEGDPVPIKSLVLVRAGYEDEDGEEMNPRKKLSHWQIAEDDTVVVHLGERSSGIKNVTRNTLFIFFI